MSKNDKWIQDANLDKGTFTRQAKRAGYDNVQAYANFVLDPKNASKTTEKTKRRARLAQTFEKMGRGAVANPGQWPYYLLETSDIDDYLHKRDSGFVGTYSKSQIPKVKKMMEGKSWASAVINLDDNAGSHWCALIKDGDTYYWIDPLGGIPPKIVIKELHPLRYSNTIYQDATDSSCGLWAIRIILHWKK